MCMNWLPGFAWWLFCVMISQQNDEQEVIEMVGYYCLALMSVLIILLSIRLVSKRHHCEKFTTLFLFMLAFMCMIDLQIIGEITQQVRIFWGIAIVLGGGALVYDASSSKTYYYLKDFQVQDDRHRERLENLIRDFRLKQLPLDAVLKIDYRLLVMEKVPPDAEKACLKLINDYINNNDCSDIKDWRFMILFASTLQLIAVVVLVGLKIWQG